MVTGGGVRRVLVVGARAPLPPQPAARNATASTPSAQLRTQANFPNDAGSLLVRLPARLDRPFGAARKPARSLEARPTDTGHASTADVAARQVLELERRRLESLGRDEEVGADEQLLRAPGLPDEGDDLPGLRAVPNHAARQVLVHTRRVPDRRRMAERPEDEQMQSDDGQGSH